MSTTKREPVNVIPGSELYFALGLIAMDQGTPGTAEVDLRHDGKIIVLDGKLFYDPVNQREIIGTEANGEHIYVSDSDIPF